MNTHPPEQTGEQPEDAPQSGPDLSHLLGEVDQEAQASDQAQAQAEQQIALQQINEARIQLRAALGMAKIAARPKFRWWSDFDACWSDDQLDAIADAGAQIMQMHGLSMGELMSRWGPYLALIMAAGVPALATYAAIQERREQLAKPRPPVMAPPPSPPSSAQEGIRL